MNTKRPLLKDPIVLAGGIIFLGIFLYYAVVNPVIPYNYDDWRYFGFFESDPVPRLGRWNITRLMPEYLMPISGDLAAFVIFPLVGDYLVSASISLAILMALFLTILFIASYRLFHALCENSNICIVVSAMMMILCFAIFKHDPESNVHMFFADDYNLYFFYVLPNILNSVIVLVMMREIVMNKKLSIRSNPSMKTGLLLIGIYFCIFSMLFSAGIVLSFAVTVVIYRLFVAFHSSAKISQKLKAFLTDLTANFNLAVIIILGMGVAMILELQSGRSNAEWDSIYTGSLFSIEFLKRIALSASGFITKIKSINNYVVLIIVSIVLMAALCYMKRKDYKNPIVGIAARCLVSLFILAFFYTMVAAKGGIDRTGLVYCIYGVFFFLVLFISLLSIYILREMEYSRIFVPLFMMIMIMVVINSTRWPYQSFHTKEKATITNQVIMLISEASDQGEEEIVLYVPDDYPLPLWAVSRLSHTLYYHNVTSMKMRILDVRYSEDNSFYYVTE